ncbi:c-type cytochrome [Pseudodesulfovibrio tunisiensis]|uniref:c-type cytochrome n=1 Tax=Pseudodesulfovibrio tunisiensis TaxID=463192 RepID=UPI001FB250D1|nr:c-type cytochrome [Pseudodesulfovibrio tunisiensis]
MKKMCLVLAAICVFAVTSALAMDADTATLYNKKCGNCHGKDGAKTSGASGGVALKGQSAAEIEKKLNGYLDGTYGGKKKKSMARQVKKLDPEQIKALSEYIGTL